MRKRRLQSGSSVAQQLPPWQRLGTRVPAGASGIRWLQEVRVGVGVGVGEGEGEGEARARHPSYPVRHDEPG